MSGRRVLVTGGAGFIGRSLVPRLLERDEVTLLLPEAYGAGRALPPPLDKLRAQYDVAYADLRNRVLSTRAVAQAAPDIVLHLAAAGVRDPFLSPYVALNHNVTGLLNLMTACFDRGHATGRLVVARTPGELFATNVYAASKAAAWALASMYVRAAGWPIVGAMPFQTYGPQQPATMLVPAAIRAALEGKDFPMTDGRQQKDWIHVDDVAGGLLALLDGEFPPGETVELGTGRATSVLEVVQRIYELAGHGGKPLPGRVPNRPGEVLYQVADLSRTRELLDWNPSTSLEEGLNGMVAEYSQRG